jgi:hypothetical protein
MKITQILRHAGIAGLLCAGFLLSAQETGATKNAGATEPFAGWKQSSTAHFRFIYEDASRERAEGFARIADSVWNKIAGEYSVPPKMTDVLVTGRTDTVNAYAKLMSGCIGLYVNPPLSPEFGYRENWQTLFFTHELVHIANFSFEGKQNKIADFFGPAFKPLDFYSVPGWALEGLATVLETDLTSGGRGRSPFFEMRFKALSLDNSWLPFDAIDTETDPPAGNAYTYGYLLMQSIADRFGIHSLADIERNRTATRSFPESVKLVTGYTIEELFMDMKVSLAKKYALERAIPEGKTVTPRVPDTSFYRPALVSATGIIAIRDAKNQRQAAVNFNPQTGKEKILFEGNFAGTDALAADSAGNLVAALKTERGDRLPGYTVSSDLYTWTPQTGVKQLTRGTSLFQPSLSRSGTTLVAVELSGAQYRLVGVNIRTGERRVLLESPTESYIQPALSPDGSQISFLILDGTRAVLASAPMPRYDFAWPLPRNTVSKLYNETGPILDIAWPGWTADGKLLFTSNERGRLEVFEYRNGESVPVVSDPVGACWADVTGEGIWYLSYAGTGSVIRMKPASEWGKVPDFTGPSLPGKIVASGNLASDYPSFSPFPPDKSAAKWQKRKEGDHTGAVLAEPAKESPFINYPRLLLVFPTVSWIQLPGNTNAYGAGAFGVWSGLPLQNGAQGNAIIAGGAWYPSIAQADAFALAQFPVYTGQILFYGGRGISRRADSDTMVESSEGLLSGSFPLYNRAFGEDNFDLALVTTVQGLAERSDTAAFSAASRLPLHTGIVLGTGVDLAYHKTVELKYDISVKATPTVSIARFPDLSQDLYFAPEFNGIFSAGNRKVAAEFSLRGRWFDFPAGAPVPGTLVTPKGEILDCLYPGRSIFEIAVVIPRSLNYRFFVEKLVSWGTNSAGQSTPDTGNLLNIGIDKYWYGGFEIEADAGRSRIAFGLVNHFSGTEHFDAVNNTRAYLSVKLDGLEKTVL